MPTRIDIPADPVCPRCRQPITYGTQEDHDADHAGAEHILSIVESADKEDWLMGADSRNSHDEIEFLPVIGFSRKQGKQKCGYQLYYMRGGYWPRNNTIKRLSVDEALQHGMFPWSSLFTRIENTRELWPSVANAVMRLSKEDRRELLLGRPLPKNMATSENGQSIIRFCSQRPWRRNGSMPVPGWIDERGGYLHMHVYDTLRRLDEDGLLENCLPEKTAIFRAFDLVRFEDVRVVVLGQDPYPDPKDAMGLAFSSRAAKLPASLRNIYKEMQDDIGGCPPNGDLTKLAYQGVLLANTSLTLGKGGESHAVYWHNFTKTWITALALRKPVVWILWGKHAQAWRGIIQEKGRYSGQKQVVIESAHPSPLSARHGFFGSRPFSKANEALVEMGAVPIDWAITRASHKPMREKNEDR